MNIDYSTNVTNIWFIFVHESFVITTTNVRSIHELCLQRTTFLLSFFHTQLIGHCILSLKIASAILLAHETSISILCVLYTTFMEVV